MVLDEPFEPSTAVRWQAVAYVPGQRSLAWPAATQPAGLCFNSQALDVLTCACPVGAGPFEFAVELEVTAGEGDPSAGNNGLVVALGSAPADRPCQGAWTVLFAVVQQGVIATVQREGGRFAVEQPGGLWRFPGREVAAPYQLSMTGTEGRDYSVAWPTKDLAGSRLRFHAWRDGRDTIRLTVYHADGAAGPWWEAQTTLSAGLREVPLGYVSLHTGREAEAFGHPAEPVPSWQGLSGVVRRVQVRKLAVGEGPELANPFPAAVLAGDAPPVEARPMLLPRAGGLESLRRKFTAPAFANYRAVLLRNASDRRLYADAYGTAGQGNRLCALLWAYLLTGQSAYYEQFLPELDAMIGLTDKLPGERPRFPGHLRQLLDIREFMGHCVADVAMAYDLLGEQLDAPRRDRIRFLLRRALRHYLDRCQKQDWWYVANPSNTIGVAHGTMGLVALALRHDQPELSRQVVDAAVFHLAEQYAAIRGDGACVEGNMYWNYGLSYPLLLGHALRNVTGSDRGLLTQWGLRYAHRYVETNLGGDGLLIPFNDTQPWLNGWLVCAHAGSEFDQPLMRWMADQMARQFAEGGTVAEQDRGWFAVAAFLYRDDTPAPEEFPGVPSLSISKGVQEGVMRSDGRRFVPALVTAAKGGGSVTTHHANQDQGSFVVYAHGEAYLIDPGYYDDAAQSHSLPLLGDAAAAKLNPLAPCYLFHAWESGDLRSMTVESTDAYNSGPHAKVPLCQCVRRVFVQMGADAVVLLDDVTPTDPTVPVTAQYQLGLPSEIGQGGSVLITGTNGSLTLTTFGPALRLRSTPRTFSAHWWVYASKKVPWHTLAGSYLADCDNPLITVLTPAERGQRPAAAAVTHTAGRIEVRVGANRIVFYREADPWQPKPRWKAARP